MTLFWVYGCSLISPLLPAILSGLSSETPAAWSWSFSVFGVLTLSVCWCLSLLGPMFDRYTKCLMT